MQIRTFQNIFRKLFYFNGLETTHNIRDDYEKENRCLKQAAAIKPGNLVVNCRLANSFEKIGNGNEAVKSYNAALGDPNIWSDNLKNYVTNQIERVKTEGPAKKPSVPRLKYMTH